MYGIVAKKYTQALMRSVKDPAELEADLQIFKDLSLVFKDKKVYDLLASPFLNKNQKESLVLGVLDQSNRKICNFVKLLNHSSRLLLIPHIALELEKRILALKKEYVAKLVSREELDSGTLQKIQASLANKLGVKLSIKQELSGLDGIKLSVEDLGIEVAFSKERFASDLKNHILKAI